MHVIYGEYAWVGSELQSVNHHIDSRMRKFVQVEWILKLLIELMDFIFESDCFFIYLEMWSGMQGNNS